MKKGPVCIGGLNFPSMLLVADCGCFVFGLRARFAVLLVFVVSCPYDKIRISDWGMCTSSLRLVVGVLFLPPFFSCTACRDSIASLSCFSGPSL